ncbi:MAG: peptidoglycan bridge formation glycyltransferase FemA/FemB family protein [Bacilli bacterium]|nr:peptidoglycan bridge formation glycyltransferase FemA/FemB family protein [Bacilli bacterium]
MKLVTLNQQQFNKYASSHRYRSYYQTSAYGLSMLKLGYNVHYFGIVDGTNSLIGATMILYKEVFMNNKIAYAPRGILFDYSDSKKVKELAECLKNLLGKQGFMLLRMDPYIPISIHSNDGNLINMNNQESIILENLATAKFEYKGKNLYFENEKPRWEALVLLNKNEEVLFESFDKRTRNKIRKAKNIGIEVYNDTTKDIKDLYEFVGKKDKKPIKYYEALVKNFGENIDVYYAKINTETFIINSRKMYENELLNNEQLAERIQQYAPNDRERQNTLNKKMESDKLIGSYKNNMLLATELLKKHPNGILIGGALVIKYDNAAYIVSDGYNEKFSSLNASYLIKWQMISDYNQQGLKYLNMNAVVGEFEKKNQYSGLNEMKLGFNTIVTEYIGEFDLILNNFAYNLFKSFNKEK